jgi:hypothetical protein
VLVDARFYLGKKLASTIDAHNTPCAFNLSLSGAPIREIAYATGFIAVEPCVGRPVSLPPITSAAAGSPACVLAHRRAAMARDQSLGHQDLLVAATVELSMVQLHLWMSLWGGRS